MEVPLPGVCRRGRFAAQADLACPTGNARWNTHGHHVRWYIDTYTGHGGNERASPEHHTRQQQRTRRNNRVIPNDTPAQPLTWGRRVVRQHYSGKQPGIASDLAQLCNEDTRVQPGVVTDRAIALDVAESTDSDAVADNGAFANRHSMTRFKCLTDLCACVDDGMRADVRPCANGRRPHCLCGSGGRGRTNLTETANPRPRLDGHTRMYDRKCANFNVGTDSGRRMNAGVFTDGHGA